MRICRDQRESPAFPVILRSEATKNLNAKLEGKILRFAQDDKQNKGLNKSKSSQELQAAYNNTSLALIL